MMKHWAVVLPLLVVGCSGPQDANGDGIADGVLKPDTVSVVAPSTPKGTVSGQVLDPQQQPISDATVSLTIGSATTDAPVTAKSDASGNFMFTNVPAGAQVLATITKDGYATLRANSTVPSTAGNIPIDNGNANIGVVTLAQSRSTVRFTITTSTGRPAVGAQAYIQAVPSAFSTTGTSAVASVVGTAQADAQGVLTFGNMPSASDLQRIGTLAGYGSASIGYQLWIDPVDVNGDGIYESAGYSALIKASDLASYGPSRIIELTPPINEGTTAAAFGLRISNVPSLTGVTRDPLRNLLRSNEPLYLAFTQPVVKNSLLVTITDEAGVVGGNGVVTANATSDAFTVALPSSPAIVDGQRYHILMRATSAYDGTTIGVTQGYFISGDVKSPKSVDPAGFATVAFRDLTTGTVGRLDSGECVIITFNQVVLTPEVAFTPVEAFFNFTLGNTGAKGEYNTPASTATTPGFPLIKAAPPINAANCITDTVPTPYPIDTVSFQYTPRYYFVMATASGVSVPVGTLVKIAFNKQWLLGGAIYETAWATPLSTDVEVQLSKQ
jgi:hypothetical protein